MKPLNRWTELVSNENGINRAKIYSKSNPKYFMDTYGKYYPINLSYSSSKSNSNINSFVLFDRNINSVGIRTDNNKTKYVGVRPDDTQLMGSQQYEWSIEEININGNDIPIDVSSFSYDTSSLVSNLGNVKIQSDRNSFRQMIHYTGSIDDFKITYKLHLNGLTISNEKYTNGAIIRYPISCSLIDCGNISGSQYLSMIDKQTHSQSILSTYITDDTLIINPKFSPNPYYNYNNTGFEMMSGSEFTVNTSSFSTIIRDSDTFWQGDNTNDYMSSIYVKDNLMFRFRDINLAKRVNKHILSILNAEMDGQYIRIKGGKKVGSYVYLSPDTSYITLALNDITHISSSFRYKNFDDFSHITMSHSDLVTEIQNQLVNFEEVSADTSYYKTFNGNFYIKDSDGNLKYIIKQPLFLDSNYKVLINGNPNTTHTLKDNGDGTYEYTKYPDEKLLFSGVPSETNYIDVFTHYSSVDGFCSKTGLNDSNQNTAWDTARDSATSSNAYTSLDYIQFSTQQNFTALGGGGKGGFNVQYTIDRAFLEFDTSAVDNSHIANMPSDVKLYYYASHHIPSPSFHPSVNSYDSKHGPNVYVVSGTFGDEITTASFDDWNSSNPTVFSTGSDATNSMTGSHTIITGSEQYIQLNTFARIEAYSRPTMKVGLITSGSDYNDNNNFALNEDWADGARIYSSEAGVFSDTGSLFDRDPYLYITWPYPGSPAKINVKSGKMNITSGKVSLH